MTKNSAASAATAKLCPEDRFVTIRADVAHDIVLVVDNAAAALGEYRASILNGSTRNGEWIADNASALDLAIVEAAIEGLDDARTYIVAEEESVIDPEEAARLRFRSIDLRYPERRVMACVADPTHGSIFFDTPAGVDLDDVIIAIVRQQDDVK